MPVAAVLDTNVALDWLVFRDPRVETLVAAVTSGALVWYGVPAMRDELAHVLRRPALRRWAPDEAVALDTYDRYVRPWVGPLPGAGPSLRCRDSDDQPFVDLALAAGARWLFSHDRALLDLARGARPFGLAIVTPVAWAAPAG